MVNSPSRPNVRPVAPPHLGGHVRHPIPLPPPAARPPRGDAGPFPTVNQGKKTSNQGKSCLIKANAQIFMATLIRQPATVTPPRNTPFAPATPRLCVKNPLSSHDQASIKAKNPVIVLHQGSSRQRVKNCPPCPHHPNPLRASSVIGCWAWWPSARTVGCWMFPQSSLIKANAKFPERARPRAQQPPNLPATSPCLAAQNPGTEPTHQATIKPRSSLNQGKNPSNQGKSCLIKANVNFSMLPAFHPGTPHLCLSASICDQSPLPSRPPKSGYRYRAPAISPHQAKRQNIKPKNFPTRAPRRNRPPALVPS